MRCSILITVSILFLTGSLLPIVTIGQDAIETGSGLTIRMVADDDIVPDCTSVAVDSTGKIYASGPGYLKSLIDTDSDGSLDRIIMLSDRPSHGAHGICVDGSSLYFVGDGGVWRMDDSDRDGMVDTEPTMVMEAKTGGEHHAHALRKGPDGFWYLIAGNNAESMFSLQNAEETLIPNPRAGVIWRISPDWKVREVWAHGFRNAYDFDFAPDHAIDVFDSDGEREVSLPWYRPTRVFRVHRGDDAGWLSRSWKRANCDPQMPVVLAEFGRGSPTGVLRSRPGRVASVLGSGVFVLDWTFGRVLFVREDGSTELVAQPTGTAGFAVTDINSTPDGRIVVSVGGRRSRGAIYMIDAVDPNGDGRVRQADWDGPPTSRKTHPIVQTLIDLRNRPEPQVDQAAARAAIDELERPDINRDEVIAACALLIESVGGLGAGNPKDARGEFQAAAVFDSCRGVLRPLLEPSLIHRATDILVQHVERTNDDLEVRNELIRAIAVLEPDSRSAFDCVMTDLARVSSPTDKLHRLMALARLPVKRSDAMTEQIAGAMLQIPRMIEASDAKIDTNWVPRLGELFVALEERDSLLPSRLVATPDFGMAADLVWTERMDPENLERARQRILARDDASLMDPRVARFVARGNDVVPPRVIRRWLADPATRPSGWLATASHARPADIELLREAALSVDAEAKEASVAALMRLGQSVPERVSDSQTVQRWLSRADAIATMNADTLRGKNLFEQRQCATCHNGAKALGPPLEGVSKRFSTEDLFRSTVDPSHTISDRYRSKKVLTADDQIINGMVIYESVDGVTLITADTKMKRINAESIVEIQDSDVSLMPEGLLDGMTDQQVADLLTYLRSL